MVPMMMMVKVVAERGWLVARVRVSASALLQLEDFSEEDMQKTSRSMIRDIR